MPDSSTAEIEIESLEEKPLKKPFNNPNPVRGTAYSKKMLEWIAYNNRKTEKQGK